MNNNFGGAAVLPAIAGFFFGKRAKVQEVQIEHKQTLPAVVKSDSSELTGVAKYLATVPLATSVSKYLKKQEKQPITSVEKYVLRQTIAEKNVPPASSVAKYLIKTEKDSATHRKSTVDKYLTNLEFASKQSAVLTGVAKYQAEQDLIDKKNAAAALIQRYKEQEKANVQAAKEAAKAAAVEAAMAKYIEVVEEEPAATGVGRYVQTVDAKTKNTPKATGVAKYIAKQIAIDSQKPALSSVGKYLRDQALAESKKPALSGVAKYLAKQPKTAPLAQKKPLVTTGVAKYLASIESVESAKPVRSGVAKYLEAQGKLEAKNVKLIGQLIEEKIPEAIEGEFIPAREFASETGVSRYLQKVNQSPGNVSKVPLLTGVAKYLNQQANQTPVARPTGVDKYLLARTK